MVIAYHTSEIFENQDLSVMIAQWTIQLCFTELVYLKSLFSVA